MRNVTEQRFPSLCDSKTQRCEAIEASSRFWKAALNGNRHYKLNCVQDPDFAMRALLR